MLNKYEILDGDGNIVNTILADESFVSANYEHYRLIEAVDKKLELPKKIRLLRNDLLAETDWWVLPDRTATQEQLDYRQSLRDVTAQEGFPENVIWPEKPS